MALNNTILNVARKHYARKQITRIAPDERLRMRFSNQDALVAKINDFIQFSQQNVTPLVSKMERGDYAPLQNFARTGFTKIRDLEKAFANVGTLFANNQNYKVVMGGMFPAVKDSIVELLKELKSAESFSRSGMQGIAHDNVKNKVKWFFYEWSKLVKILLLLTHTIE